MQQLIEILRNLTVLYAEDDDAIRANTTKTLQMLFGRVLVAKDGVEALAYYVEEKIHIALLDYVMPCVDGYEVAREIRAHDHHVPIIICSGYTDQEKLLGAIRLGVIEYIEKPMAYEALVGDLAGAVQKLRNQQLLHVKFDSHLAYDVANQCVLEGANKIDLTCQEAQVLGVLVRHQNHLITKEQLQEALHDSNLSDNALRNIVYRLRKKLKTECIVTVKDMGYFMASKRERHGY